MARPLRIEFPGAWYHVLNRGRRRERVFFAEVDYKKFLALLGEVTALFSAQIHAYSLMPNHYHLIICTPCGNLSRIMRHVNGVFTQCSNMSYRREGSLFKGRFKSILIDHEEYLLELVRYIHRNPLKSGLEKRLGEHPWTSHHAYMLDEQKPPWLCTEEVLSRFGRYKEKAKKAFHAFVGNEMPLELEAKLDSMRWPAILGGDAFHEIVKRYAWGEKRVDAEVVPRNIVVDHVSLEQVAHLLESIARVPYGSLRKPRLRGVQGLKRAFVYFCRETSHSKQHEICEMLGGVNGAIATRLYSDAKKAMGEKGEEYSLIQKLYKRLSQLVKT
ncbi:MAG: transposase [Candidatus Omnitrophica bacterium]|nr:transposase [Candidatus Omnitrophota bacterium]